MLIWFVTGASRGFGRQLSELVLERGDAVVATARDPSRLAAELGPRERLLTVALDVTDPDAANAAVAGALARFGRIDVLVNNAGRGLIGAVEEASEAEVQAVFENNVFGTLAVTRAALPSMRERRSGTIVNVSSVGGMASRSGGGIYAGTKFAIEGISEALRAELAPLGIRVVIVEPGAFRTDFHDPGSIHFSRRVIDDYASTAGEFRALAESTNHRQRGDPRKAAAAMIAAATAADPPQRLVLGADALARIAAKLDQVRSDLDAWREVTVSTDLEEE
jgi:NAD(P)-dependent dehydrogenase (short-subunit alcohol dehydrogenase family)